MTIKQHKVVAVLPEPLQADSVYYVRVGNGFDLYVTNSLGQLTRYELNVKLSLDALIQRVNTLETANNGLLFLPAYLADGTLIKLSYSPETPPEEPVDPIQGYDIILYLGQSNAAGRVSLANSPQPYNELVDQFGSRSSFVDTFQKIVPLSNPILTPDPTTTNSPFRTGPMGYFASIYQAALGTSRKVLLVPVNVGGTAMVSGSNPRWSPDGTGGDLYNLAISQGNAAVAAAQLLYPNSKVVGTVWHQGETDGTNGASKEVYAAGLTTIINDIRTRINTAAGTWFIINQLLPESRAANAGYRVIDEAHQQVAAADPLVGYAPCPAGYSEDGLHLTINPGHIIMAQSTFDTIQGLSDVVPPEEPEEPEEPPVDPPPASSFYDEANIVAAWKADSLTLTEGANIAEWPGLYNNLTLQNTDATRQPTFRNNIYGRKAADFSGKILRTITSLMATQGVSVYVLACPKDSATTGQTAICTDTGSSSTRGWHLKFQNNTGRFISFIGPDNTGLSAEGGGAMKVEQWQVLSGVRTTANITAGIDNVTGAPTSKPSTNLASTPIIVGGRGANIEFINAYIAEIRVYEAAHTPEQREAVIAQMKGTN